jgi:hypothetical protein
MAEKNSYLDLFFNLCHPAEESHPDSKNMNTMEIYNMIQEVLPGVVTVETLGNELSSRHFKLTVEENRLKWVVRLGAKENS